MTNARKAYCPVALTMGDPAGIGPELTCKAWRQLKGGDIRFVWLGDPMLIAPDLPVRCVASGAEAWHVFGDALPVIPLKLATKPIAGKPDERNVAATIASITQATQFALEGSVSAVVTNPISKSVLNSTGFGFPGHTEYLAHLCGVAGSEIMMLVSPQLRVVPVTIHMSLCDAINKLDAALIVKVGTTLINALRSDFGIEVPRIGVAGLNPHAGEDGHMGDEERRLIMPAIEQLRSLGAEVSGPMPPDTMFTASARQGYDAALCMYHDQALIPLKTLDVAHGVNVTLGLPIVRTSPDHGTAFDIAGGNLADVQSLIEALLLGAHLGQAKGCDTALPSY